MMKPAIVPLQTSFSRHVIGRFQHRLGLIEKTDVPPSPAEAKVAQQVWDSALRPAVFGELGGTRPIKTDRHTSWWGGCMLAGPGDVIPSGRHGRPMSPLLQVVTSEVGLTIPGLADVAILTLWLDLTGNLFEAEEGIDFVVSTYRNSKSLVPLGPGYRESDALPTFPIVWQDATFQQPAWEDFSPRLPKRVAWSDTADWFFENDVSRKTGELQRRSPIKLGGWPTWIQGSQIEGEDQNLDFVLQIDSTDKGRVGFGDGGSVYLFRDNRDRSWRLLCDFY